MERTPWQVSLDEPLRLLCSSESYLHRSLFSLGNRRSAIPSGHFKDLFDIPN